MYNKGLFDINNTLIADKHIHSPIVWLAGQAIADLLIKAYSAEPCRAICKKSIIVAPTVAKSKPTLRKCKAWHNCKLYILHNICLYKSWLGYIVA